MLPAGCGFRHLFCRLPEFLARSVDADTQQKLIFEGLDQGIKDYLARIGADADNRCEQRWSSEQAGMRAEMDDLRRKSEQVAQERADLKQKQLSADRQKRALSDRLKDLENQVRRLEAEREQFDLENAVICSVGVRFEYGVVVEA